MYSDKNAKLHYLKTVRWNTKKTILFKNFRRNFQNALFFVFICKRIFLVRKMEKILRWNFYSSDQKHVKRSSVYELQ